MAGATALWAGFESSLSRSFAGMEPSSRPRDDIFDFRLLLGWINDNSPVPLAGKRWPITDVDDKTVETYKAFFQTAKDSGYNGITLWGLYASHAWKVPLKDSLESARRKVIDQILHLASDSKIKILYGLGVYSWGFEEIIKKDRSTARNEGRMVWGSYAADNGVAMCYQSQSARQWMRDIVDFCVKEVGTDGFGFQSGDLGRCFCKKCRKMTDTEYHSCVIDETASYIRSQHPDQILGMSAWGVEMGGGPDSIRKLTSHLDFLTDVTDQSARKGSDYRRSLTGGLNCAIGSLGGAVVVPPQRWARDRWFMPHPRMAGESIRSLHADGGRSFEFFMGPLNNPHFEIMTRYVGLLLNHPEWSCEQTLEQVVDSLFSPDNSRVSQAIVQWIFDAERAYVSRLGDISSGEFDFEPLKNESAGEPVYLIRLSSAALQGYHRDLESLSGQLAGFSSECRRPEKLKLIGRCLENVRCDLEHVLKSKSSKT